MIVGTSDEHLQLVPRIINFYFGSFSVKDATVKILSMVILRPKNMFKVDY